MCYPLPCGKCKSPCFFSWLLSMSPTPLLYQTSQELSEEIFHPSGVYFPGHQGSAAEGRYLVFIGRRLFPVNHPDGYFFSPLQRFFQRGGLIGGVVVLAFRQIIRPFP